MLFSEQLRAARAILRMDQSELARRAGVSVETIKRLERMESEISASPGTVDKIMGALRDAGIEFINPGSPSLVGGGGIRLVPPEDARLYELIVEVLHTGIVSAGAAILKRDPEAMRKPPAEIIDAFLAEFPAHRDALVERLARQLPPKPPSN